MSRKWEDYEESFLEGNLTKDPREVHALFIEKYGLTRSLDAVRQKINRLRETEESVVEPTTALHLLDPAIVKEQSRLWLRSINEEYSQFTYRVRKPLKSKKRSLVIVISDVHWGKKTDSFNMDEANRRILSIVDHLLADDLPEFDEIVVVLLGDLVEGEDIFATQANLIEAPVITAHKQGTEIIWKLLLSLRDAFNLPVRVECAPGNHGRQSKTAHPASNWDNAIAQSLSLILKYSNEKNIKINLNLKEFNTIEVKNCRILLNHKGIKHVGTPAMFSKLAGWIISKDIDVLIHGHWHNTAMDTYLGRTRISNGCVPGGDNLGEQIAREDPARQVYFLVDPNKSGFVSHFNYIQWE